MKIYYVGQLPLKKYGDITVVKDDRDYVQACVLLTSQEPGAVPGEIWVRSQTHVAWLEDFAERIGRPVVNKTMTARDVLAEQWNVAIPEWLTDADIIEGGLLDLEVETGSHVPFSDRMIGHFLGSGLYAGSLHGDNLGSVVQALSGEPAETAFQKHPLLNRCLEDKCRRWAEAGEAGWVAEVCAVLPESRQTVWQWVSFGALLGGYPSKLLEYVLPPGQVWTVQKMPGKGLENIGPEPSARDAAIEQIDLFFEGILDQIDTSEAFQKVLAFTSGRLAREFQWLARLITEGRFPATQKDVEGIQKRFEHCPGLSGFQLASLGRYVKPETPPLLDDEREWTDTEWIRWAVDAYLPYRTWQVNNHYSDAAVEDTVKRFSQWYLAQYAAIHKDADLSMVHFLGKALSEETGHSAVIILMIDCLPLNFFGLLDRALQNTGFARHALEHRFVPLPTVTTCTKPEIISGNWNVDGKDYERLLKQRAAAEWGRSNAIYVSNLKSLASSTLSLDAPVLLLNFVDCDELLHTDMEARHMTHEEQLQFTFNRLAEDLAAVAATWEGSREDVTVLVLTDHGACRVLDEERTTLESSVINKIFPDERHRYAFIEESSAKDVPDNLWELGHVFNRPFVSETGVFFIPSGHNTVKCPSGARSGYVHGGATPEEVIVPAARYKLVKAPWKGPSVRFLDLAMDAATGKARFYIQRLVSVKLEIQNPNSAEMVVQRAGVTAPETDLKGCETPKIPGGGIGVLRLDCYFKKPALEADELVVEFEYEVAGEKRVKTVSLKSEFRSAMSTGLSLKDL
jgi:hypothetical protein